MKTRILFFIMTIGMIGCIPKSEYDKKKQECQILKERIIELEAKVEEKQKQDNICTEDFALEQLKDYLSFYAPKCKFKDFKVRANGRCVYDISMNKYHSRGSIIGVIVRLKFNNDGTYNISNIDNDPTWACN
jgi:hypothetical protein